MVTKRSCGVGQANGVELVLFQVRLPQPYLPGGACRDISQSFLLMPLLGDENRFHLMSLVSRGCALILSWNSRAIDEQ